MNEHAANTQQICKLIRLAAASCTNRFGTSSQKDFVEGDLEQYEIWTFGFSSSSDEKLLLQSVTCLLCGDYLCSSAVGATIHLNAKCKCCNEYESEKAVENKKKMKRERIAMMNNYDSFDAFVKVVLPEGAPDRLCEDVIGEISRFLV